MSDVLSPAEQARAARWAADWLTAEKYRSGARALHNHADDLDQLVTVESLRAERDKVQEGSDAWQELATKWRDRCLERRDEVRAAVAMRERVEHESRDIAAALDAMRVERDELVLTVAEIAGERNRAEEESSVWEETAGEFQSRITAVTEERDSALKDATFRRDWLKVRADLDAANATIARLRSTHAQAEAAWGRCQRED